MTTCEKCGLVKPFLVVVGSEKLCMDCKPKDVFACREKCGECCCLLPFKREVYERYKEKITWAHEIHELGENDITISREFMLFETPQNKHEALRCGFLDDNARCILHDTKNYPEICKMYGTHATSWEDGNLMCPYFYPDGRQRNREERRKLLQYVHRCKKKLDVLIEEKEVV